MCKQWWLFDVEIPFCTKCFNVERFENEITCLSSFSKLIGDSFSHFSNKPHNSIEPFFCFFCKLLEIKSWFGCYSWINLHNDYVLFQLVDLLSSLQPKQLDYYYESSMICNAKKALTFSNETKKNIYKFKVDVISQVNLFFSSHSALSLSLCLPSQQKISFVLNFKFGFKMHLKKEFRHVPSTTNMSTIWNT